MKEPVWIEQHEVLALHGRLLALDGGAGGVRDLGLLQSALARPQQLHAYSKKPDVVDMAAAYIAGIIRNHPFVDGNKRIGFVVGALFLELNGKRFVASQPEATQVIMDLAAGTLDEPALVKWLKDNVR